MSKDKWSNDSNNLLSPGVLENIRNALDKDYIVVEHMHYAGGSAKDTLLFYDFDMFMEYIQAKTKPGDLFYIYSLGDLYESKQYLLRAKYPDEQGRTPATGPY